MFRFFSLYKKLSKVQLENIATFLIIYLFALSFFNNKKTVETNRNNFLAAKTLLNSFNKKTDHLVKANDYNDYVKNKNLLKSLIEKFNVNRTQTVFVGNQKELSHTTIVTIYFKLRKSKHRHIEFYLWLRKFLKSVNQQPLIIITDFHSKDFIIEQRKALNLTTKLIIYSSVWDVMKELENSRNKSYITKYITEQHSKQIVLKYLAKNFKLFVSSKRISHF
jgi:hypothetical protein